LVADTWSFSSREHGSLDVSNSMSDKVERILFHSPVQPWPAFSMMIRQMFITLRFRQILRSSTNPEPRPDTMLIWVVGDILVVLFGINQPPGFLKRTRIIASAPIVLGLSESTKLQPSHVYTRRIPLKEDNMADALTLGHKSAETSCLMEVNEAGKLA
jgi:hypothetical protein